jgi:uncharacterized membrane protein YgcG
MMKKRQLVVLAMLVSIIMTTAPASALLYGQGQIQESLAEELVDVADKAEQKVKNIIDLIYANEIALQKIEEVGLVEELEGNVTLFGEGVASLTAAYDSLEISDYDLAADYATESLSVFREVYSFIQVILEAAGLQEGYLVDNQGLLEAVMRELQRIDYLREILPEYAPDDIKQLLDDAEHLLDIEAVRTLLLEGKETEVLSNLQDAKQLISQVYQYLKEEAEYSNTWRILSYCERVQERIRERFRAGTQAGIDFTSVLQSLGYQSETQFMEILQNMIQTTQGKTDSFKNALQDLEAIGNMVQEMDQALNQEIQRHQGGNGSAGGDGGNGPGGMGGGGSGSGSNGL